MMKERTSLIAQMLAARTRDEVMAARTAARDFVSRYPGQDGYPVAEAGEQLAMMWAAVKDNPA